MKRKRVVAMLVEPQRFELQEEEVEVSPDQVWVRVEACGVCHSEMVFYLGRWQGMRLPLKMGHEHAGVIEEVGSEVRGWKVGDRVTCLPGPGFATHVAADPSQIARVPDGLEIDHALGERRSGAQSASCLLAEPRGRHPTWFVGSAERHLPDGKNGHPPLRPQGHWQGIRDGVIAGGWLHQRCGQAELVVGRVQEGDHAERNQPGE